jgi:coproporphyrinogen III oxidase-like Fe-S oxidoreductase
MLDALLGATFRQAARRSMRFRPSDGIAHVPAAPLAAYLHVPFCEVLCPYCSFHRVRFEPQRARRYFAALRSEIRGYHERGFRFHSLSVGGGTPTVVPGELAETLALFRSLNPGVGEISVETNPKDVREEVVALLLSVGVTRLSVGVQTFDDALLAHMLRLEKYGSRAQILDHLQAAAGRFPTLNLDLMWHLPGQTEAMLVDDLDTVLASPANQVSLYPLMASPSSARRIGKTLGHAPRGDRRAFYERIEAHLYPRFRPTSAWCFTRGGLGIDEYIVNAPAYVGLGSGAFSYLDGAFYTTTFSLQSYVERVERGLSGVVSERRISRREAMRYELLVGLMGLRLERSAMRRRHGALFERLLAPELALLGLGGAIEQDRDGWVLTPRGMYFWVRMMAAFFESVDEFREEMRRHIRDELGDASLEVHIPAESLRRGA